MPPPTPDSGGAPVPRFWHNWLRNIAYTVPGYFEPTTKAELVGILRRAEAEGKKVKAVGSGWSFEDCAVSEDWVVDIKCLNRAISDLTNDPGTVLTAAWANRQIDPSADKLYHVEAGIKIFTLNEELTKKSLAMLTLGGSQGQTLAGAISTSTHGSDLDQPPLAGVIQAIHLITTGGQEVWIESASAPVTANDAVLRSKLQCPALRIERDDELLRAAMVTVGRFGVIYSYIIKVTPVFCLAEWAQELSWSSVSAALAGGVGLAGTVPVRGHLGGLRGLLSSPPQTLEIFGDVEEFRFLDILLSSNMKVGHADDVCWVRRRWLTHNDEPLNVESGSNPICHPIVKSAVLVAAGAALGAYAAQVAAIPVYGAIKALQIGYDATRLNVLAHDPGVTGGDALVESLNAVWRAQIDHELEWLIADLNYVILKNGFCDALGDGRRGLGWQVSSGTEERTNDDCYRANSTELIFDTATTAYIDFINRLLDNAHRFHIGGYISIRFSSRTPASLSMHNVRTPLAVSIEVSTLHGLEGSESWVAFAEQAAKEMGGRPHWGQQNRMSTADLLTLYKYEDLLDWWHQCFLVVGPTSRTFSNNYTRQRGLEPMRRPATAAAMVSPAVLDFGRVLKDRIVTRDRGLTISNVGIGGLEIASIRLVGTQAAAFSLASLPALPVTLQQGRAFPVSVQFQGGSEGRHEGRVTIASRDLRSGSQGTMEAVLVANVVAPDMDVVPTTINFGRVQASQEVARNVLVTNNGSAPLRFRVPPPQPWSFFQWAGDGTMQWRSLPPGGSQTVAVRYAPAVIGAHSSTIAIVAEDEAVTVRLVGERVPAPSPSIQVVPREVSFGLVDAGGTKTVQLVLANDSAATLTISGARIEGPDRSLFALAGQRPNMIQAGQAAILPISFTPAGRVEGGNRATLVIDSNAANAPQMRVDLFGMGVAAAPRARWLEPVLAVMMR